MLRLFVGVMLPPEHNLQLSTICLGLHGAKWVDPGNFHVTLRFIGEVDEGIAADLDAALNEIRAPRFPVTVAGIGLFGSDDRARVLYAAVEKSPPLHLHEKVEAAAARVGLLPEGRRYVPHVTLARFQRGNPTEIARFIAANNLFRLPEFTADRFSLVASYPSKAGAIYEEAAEYPLR
jgi:2'-5' RNA ligase